MVELDRRQRVTLIWAGMAVVLAGFEGSILVVALPAIAKEFHAGTSALSNLGSVLAVGTLGALPLATLADRFGRRRLIAAGVAGFSLVTLASAYVPSLADLAFLRLFAVCFEVLVIGVATALIVEEAPAGSRGQAVSVLALLSGLGTGITVIAYPLVAPHWRWLFMAGGAGLVAAPFIWWLLPEGRTWQGVRVTGSAIRLLMQPPWRRRIVVLAAMFALLAVLLEPAGLLYTLYASVVLSWSPVQISFLIVVSGTAGAVSYLAGGYLTDRFGRRGPAIALTVATAAATSLSFATSTVGFFVGNVLWSAFASAGTPVFGAWSGELFPTRARATAEAAIALAGAIGSIVGLQAVALLSASAGLGGAIELEGVAAVAGALLLFLLPETKQQPLPE
ncbi:MAG: MFS transporter [Chloroflexi bacterium]|nr:MAG: MFS transporter [Chloroflexota bacterium]TME40646.1 MAG: MFS transporter [Chloroflexota bacterium]TME53393.1 MAG: MFS transporter [Chloroflexota bacterium]